MAQGLTYAARPFNDMGPAAFKCQAAGGR